MFHEFILGLNFDLRRIFLFLIGLTIGSLIFLITSSSLKVLVDDHSKLSDEVKVLYDDNLADELFQKIKILCMIHTFPANHKTKAIHIKNTWGRRCNKLLFVTSEQDPELDILHIPVAESRDVLKYKTKESFLYAHDNHLDGFDWFIKADDDNFFIVENLRLMLYQYRPETALFLGHRLVNKETGMDDGYMSGGGYIVSRKALIKFAEIVRGDPSHFTPDGPWEDLGMGKALAHAAVFVDCRDEMQRERFFPIPLVNVLEDNFSPDYWFSMFNYYRIDQNGLDGVSDVPVAFHYIRPEELYALDYLIYQVHPFGFEKNLTEALPRKLSLDEIIKASDYESQAPNFVMHEFYHNMTSSEYF